MIVGARIAAVMISLEQLVATREQLIAEHKHVIGALDSLIEYMQQRERAIVLPLGELPRTERLLPERPIDRPLAAAIDRSKPAGWPIDPKAATLRDYILPIARRYPRNIWTSRMMWTALNTHEVPMTARDIDSQVNTISMIMANLSENDGPLIQIEKGSGRRPSKYRLRHSELGDAT